MPIDAAARFRCGLAGVLPLVVALVVISPPAPVMAQDDIRVDGTVMWLSGQTLTLALDGQVVPGYYQIVGQYLVVVPGPRPTVNEIEEHTSELQSRFDLVCRLLLEKKKQNLQVAKR